MMRAEPDALHQAAAGARRLAEELPRLADPVTETADAAVAGCPGFATAAALADVARSWQSRLTAVGGAFAHTAERLGATAERDRASDDGVAGAFDASAHRG